jgi:hypothetical protein
LEKISLKQNQEEKQIDLRMMISPRKKYEKKNLEAI